MLPLTSRHFSASPTREGFTLPEVIVALSVLVMVIVASSQLLVTIIRNNNENINTLVAYGLAQEGLEASRNIRDSNWLIGADFQGKIGSHLVWNSALPGPGETVYYLLEANSFEDSSCSGNVTASTIAQCAPWKLKEISVAQGQDAPDPGATQLYLRDEEGLMQYVNTPQAEDRPALFHRYLKVMALDPDQPQVSRYRVSSLVTWEENNRQRKVVLTTEITDWKGGPL